MDRPSPALTNPDELLNYFHSVQKATNQFHTVNINLIVQRFVRKVYSEFQQVSQTTRSDDISRKKAFLEFITKSRTAFLRLYTLLKFTNSSLIGNRSPVKYLAINKYISEQESEITSRADGLFYLHRKMVGMVEPGYDLESALDVFTKGKVDLGCLSVWDESTEDIDTFKINCYVQNRLLLEFPEGKRSVENGQLIVTKPEYELKFNLVVIDPAQDLFRWECFSVTWKLEWLTNVVTKYQEKLIRDKLSQLLDQPLVDEYERWTQVFQWLKELLNKLAKEKIVMEVDQMVFAGGYVLRLERVKDDLELYYWPELYNQSQLVVSKSLRVSADSETYDLDLVDIDFYQVLLQVLERRSKIILTDIGKCLLKAGYKVYLEGETLAVQFFKWATVNLQVQKRKGRLCLSSAKKLNIGLFREEKALYVDVETQLKFMKQAQDVVEIFSTLKHKILMNTIKKLISCFEELYEGNDLERESCLFFRVKAAYDLILKAELRNEMLLLSVNGRLATEIRLDLGSLEAISSSLQTDLKDKYSMVERSVFKKELQDVFHFNYGGQLKFHLGLNYLPDELLRFKHCHVKSVQFELIERITNTLSRFALIIKVKFEVGGRLKAFLFKYTTLHFGRSFLLKLRQQLELLNIEHYLFLNKVTHKRSPDALMIQFNGFQIIIDVRLQLKFADARDDIVTRHIQRHLETDNVKKLVKAFHSISTISALGVKIYPFLSNTLFEWKILIRNFTFLLYFKDDNYLIHDLSVDLFDPLDTIPSVLPNTTNGPSSASSASTVSFEAIVTSKTPQGFMHSLGVGTVLPSSGLFIRGLDNVVIAIKKMTALLK